VTCQPHPGMLSPHQYPGKFVKTFREGVTCCVSEVSR
jgi:hypothetical protein